MKFGTLTLAAVAVLCAGVAAANTPDDMSAEEMMANDAVRIATESGVCGTSPVASAQYIDAGTISAKCALSAEAFPNANAAALLADARS